MNNKNNNIGSSIASMVASQAEKHHMLGAVGTDRAKEEGEEEVAKG
jgi:hypothetical protein